MAGMGSPPSVRVYDPPRQVWVRVRDLLPIGSHDLADGDPDHGIRVETEAPGLLKEAITRSDRGTLLLVTYPMWTADEWQTVVTHYVPSHLVRQRNSAVRRHGPLRHARRTHG